MDNRLTVQMFASRFDRHFVWNPSGRDPRPDGRHVPGLATTLAETNGYDAERKRFKVRSKGRNGYIWTKESNLPDVIVTAYKLDHKDYLPEGE
jgi:hypothetical protein